MAVLMIALAHAVPVFLAGLISKNQSVVWMAAVVMVIVAFATGKIAFVVWDLAAIGIGAYATLAMLKQNA